MSDICVVHLVRKRNGIEPFRHFLASYLENPGGINHDLLIIYKGFKQKNNIDPYEELLRDIPHSFLMVADIGFDLRPYFIAAEKYDSKYFCFLNSFAAVLDKDWLLKLYRHISQPSVGIVGATGSWGSVSSGRVTSKKILPLWKMLLRPLVRKVQRTYFEFYFDSFPSYHIRTNGFMISRNTMLNIRRGMIFTKVHAYRLESGKNSITKQVGRMGLRTLVVGKDGKGYDKHEWDVSNTFWRGKQENLLISDNQTRKYATADLDWRQELEIFAWGKLLSDLPDN